MSASGLGGRPSAPRVRVGSVCVCASVLRPHSTEPVVVSTEVQGGSFRVQAYHVLAVQPQTNYSPSLHLSVFSVK